MNTVGFAPQEIRGKDQGIITDLWKAFLENYNAYKNGDMPMTDEYKYKLISSPGPSQYKAFSDFFAFSKQGERSVEEEKFRTNLCMYDLLYMDKQTEPEMLRFVRCLNSSQFDPNGKQILFAFGSFWGRHLPTREKMIKEMNELDKKGADVRVFAQAKKDEEYIELMNKSIRKKSCFGLQQRIPIHYVRADDLVFLEFPHTETSEFRLNWYLNLDDVDYVSPKTKSELKRYFDSLLLVEGAKNCTMFSSTRRIRL